MKAVRMTIAKYKQKKDILRCVSNKRRSKELNEETTRLIKEDHEFIEMKKNPFYGYYDILLLAKMKAMINLSKNN